MNYKEWEHARKRRQAWLFGLACAGVAALLTLAIFWSPKAHAHAFYTGIRDKAGTICCGGNDCTIVQTRQVRGGAEFLVGDDGTDRTPSKWKGAPQKWIMIPDEKITYLPVPGDGNAIAMMPDPPPGTTYGHFCGYRIDRKPWPNEDVFGGFHFYCAFIPPGGV